MKDFLSGINSLYSGNDYNCEHEFLQMELFTAKRNALNYILKACKPSYNGETSFVTHCTMRVVTK